MRLLIPALACTAIAGAGHGRIEGSAHAKRFISDKYGFSMEVPEGWGVSTTLDIPVFLFAPPSARFVQATIPEGGAVITMESQDSVTGTAQSATTPHSWARANADAFGVNPSPIEPFQFPAESGISCAVVCSYDEPSFSPDDRTQHSVGIFWESQQKLFAAHLNYNASDPKAPELQRVFVQTVRSYRPLGTH